MLAKVLALVLGAGVAGVSFAESAVRFTGTPVRTMSAAGRSVPVYPGADVTLGGRRDVFLTGAGVRNKRILVNVPVYAATSYLDDAGGISRTDPLGSVAASATKVIQLTILRALSGQDISAAFADSLRANGIDASEAGIQRIFRALPDRLAAGDVITILGYDLADGNEGVRIEIGASVVTSTGPELAQKIWTIWFGEPSDAGLAALKTNLMGG
jgi:hypothetical protein